jgi:hypothetical protein
VRASFFRKVGTTWFRNTGHAFAMMAGLGTVIASTPSVERVRTRKFRPFRRSSIDATVTGDRTKSSCSTGASMMRRNSSAEGACPAAVAARL